MSFKVIFNKTGFKTGTSLGPRSITFSIDIKNLYIRKFYDG